MATHDILGSLPRGNRAVQWVDIAEDAHGFLAIGQRATGVIAIGQVALGGLAIGQAAFGAIAVGQLAVGGLALGMAGFGLYGAAALVGAAARPLGGWVLPLLPSLALDAPTVRVSSLEGVRRDKTGWVKLELGRQGEDPVLLASGEVVHDLRLDARLRRAALALAPAYVLAHVRPATVPGRGLVIDRLAQRQPLRVLQARWWLLWGLQLVGLLWLAAGVWYLVIEPLLPWSAGSPASLR